MYLVGKILLHSHLIISYTTRLISLSLSSLFFIYFVHL